MNEIGRSKRGEDGNNRLQNSVKTHVGTHELAFIPYIWDIGQKVLESTLGLFWCDCKCERASHDGGIGF